MFPPEAFYDPSTRRVTSQKSPPKRKTMSQEIDDAVNGYLLGRGKGRGKTRPAGRKTARRRAAPPPPPPPPLPPVEETPPEETVTEAVEQAVEGYLLGAYGPPIEDLLGEQIGPSIESLLGKTEGPDIEQLLGFSFKKFAKRVAKSANPINHIKAVAKLADPRQQFKLVRGIIKNPRNIKGNLAKLALVDPGIGAGVAMFQDLKRPDTKPKAAGALEQARAQMDESPIAKKVVGTVKQLARAEIEAPEVTDRVLAPEVAYNDDAPDDAPDGEGGDDDTSVEGQQVNLGFSFGGLLKSVTSAVKSVAPAVMSVAKLTPYGAALDTAANMVSKVAPGVAQGMGLMEKAKKGDPVAQGKVAQVQALAKAGNPEGVKALETLKQAREVHNAAVIASTSIPGASTVERGPTPGVTPGTSGAPASTVNIYLGPGTPGKQGSVEAPKNVWGSLFSAGLNG
jgi:hypothetical protein